MNIRLLVGILALFLSHSSFALKISYHAGNSAPYAMTRDGYLVGGIIKDLGEELGKILKTNIEFHFTSRGRMEKEILSGKSHLYMIFNPAWSHNKDMFLWSDPLFQERDIIVTHKKNKFDVAKRSDLYGKRLGTIYKYIYPDLESDFAKGRIIRDDIYRLEQNFGRLDKGNIDAFIGSDVLIEYYIKKAGRFGDYQINPYVESHHSLQTILSPKAPITLEQLNKAYKKMKSDGTLDRIRGKYR